MLGYAVEKGKSGGHSRVESKPRSLITRGVGVEGEVFYKRTIITIVTNESLKRRSFRIKY